MSNSKNFMSIRSKLLAAIAMLLVASFMVVSSTYAWFTLSTAPEVTGITTQIGANGNLEIALYTGVDIENSVGATNWVQKNASWGNIISLDDASYGLSNIVMKPSTLSVSKVGETITINTAAPLVTPTYGSDGRVESLTANGMYGKYATTGFIKAETGYYGVRALGTVSSMSHQQLLFANSSTALKTALALASTLAVNTLQENGEGLVNLILKGASGGDSFDATELEALGNMIGVGENLAEDASTLKDVPAKLKEAVQNYMLIQLAFAAAQLEDSAFDQLVTIFNGAWNTNFDALVDGATSITVDLPENVTLNNANTVEVSVSPAVVSFMTKYNAIVTAINNAEVAYNQAIAAAKGEVEGKTTANFADLTAILRYLMNIEKLEINGKKYSEIKAMKDNNDFTGLAFWGSSVLNSGVSLYMTDESGVYADIASITNDINAGFIVDEVSISVPGIIDEPITAEKVYVNMYTQMNAKSPIASVDAFKPADRESVGDNAVLSDSYAYVLDFAFRTNAAGSNLLLQQDAKDRIYGDNGANSQTMGGGSYMSFDVLAGSGFTATNVQSLMSHIRLVFVDTDDNTVIAGAKLKTGVINSEGNNVKASVVLCDVDVEGGYLAFGTAKTDDNQVITSLTQNEEKHISVYVYFDGVTADNSAVAAIGELSASGKLNLQFASSAELKPMDYSELKTPATPTT